MSLTDNFEKLSAEDFATALQKEVKTGDFREVLTWKTSEGIDVSPFYTSPVAKKTSFAAKGNNWEVNTEITISDVAAANKIALEVLNLGTSSISFIGEIKSAKDLESLLKGISIQHIEINFKKSGSALPQLLADYCTTQKINTEEVHGCFYQSVEDVSSFAGLISTFKNARFISVNAARLHNAGASITQQLAFVIAEGNEILFQLIEAGIKPEDAIRCLQIRTSTGPNYFFEMAKLRSLRLLWKNITEQYAKGNNIPLHIHAETSLIWLAPDDIHNNMIRATFQSMSAILGGCDSLTVSTFDQSNEENSVRLSTNIQLVLKEESFLDKVGDAAYGTYYIDEITQQLSNNAWKLFQTVENKGGFKACLENEFIQKEIHQSANQLKQDIANGNIKVIGVNKYRSDKKEKEFKSEVGYSKELGRIELFI